MESYFIEISKNNLRKLYKNIWTETYVFANLIIENKRYDVQIGFRGNQLRKHKKKSYHIKFQRPFFMDGHHELHLNAEYNDPSLMRNKLSFDFFQKAGVLAPDSNHIQLFINGKSEGIYLAIESFDQYYLKRRNLPEGSIYYATNNDANFSLYTPEGYLKETLLDGYTPKYTYQDENHLKKLMLIINTKPKEQFDEEIEKILDVEKYLRWLAGVVCTQNFDGFIHNYALYHNSKTRLFEISPWDYDGSWGRNLHGEPLELEYVPIRGYNTLTARLLENNDFKRRYRQIIEMLLQELFTPANIRPQIEELQTLILPYIEKDPYIQKNREIFIGEKDYILEFIEKRSQFLMEQLQLLA
ncbi:CotH kinase family protein [Ureibacillus sp. FSL K6-8385]|uniref:Spore coat protein n=1 Tax=Ureibacillus terrenus TaxID=118246 RepID=A0A540V3C9_9BACL|nr:CotH kinase family protein [Ureibacillus terrenus]MED3662880.1 CotH kinase family protein [Ureibacillus terrenus]MED3763864.1 CotH kinase family protein [Ureibacillus terrenus]TQE91247.1 spore coat protein [Ureibacillus terrenus]